jgi:hypothetical protein
LIDEKTPSLEAFIGSEGAILKVSWRTPRPDNLRTIQKSSAFTERAQPSKLNPNISASGS